jgi:hypothetical protein
MMIMMMMMVTRHSVSVSLNSSPLHIILLVAEFFSCFEKERFVGNQFAQLALYPRI